MIAAILLWAAELLCDSDRAECSIPDDPEADVMVDREVARVDAWRAELEAELQQDEDKETEEATRRGETYVPWWKQKPGAEP